MMDQYSGKIVKTEIFKDKPFNERVAGSIKAIHVGNVYGTFTKIIYFLACLIATSLPGNRKSEAMRELTQINTAVAEPDRKLIVAIEQTWSDIRARYPDLRDAGFMTQGIRHRRAELTEVLRQLGEPNTLPPTSVPDDEEWLGYASIYLPLHGQRSRG